VLAFLNFTSFVASSGYLAIFVLCVAQSCCVPTSSELTLGFAGVLAATGKLNLAAVIAVGATGEVLGAYVAWFIGRTGGRAFVDRWGKYLLLSHADLDRAEAWYGRHERWGVFGSRLVPFVRNFVALPAGVAEVPLLRFGLLTAAGSLIWDGAMAGIGYGVGSQWKSIMHGFSDAGYVLGVIAVLGIAFVIFHRFRSYRAATGGGDAAGGAGAVAYGRRQRVDSGSARSGEASSSVPTAPHGTAPPE
jgi:membrane protein DedA with SNARE-associated domain